MGLEKFTGNLLTQEEKAYRLKQLYEYHLHEDLDLGFLPYLEEINDFPFMCTTQCCTGHKKHQASHFDFRCSKPPEWVINNLLKPLDKKFQGLHIALYGLCCDRLRYYVGVHEPTWYRHNWYDPVEYFIELLENHSSGNYEEGRKWKERSEKSKE